MRALLLSYSPLRAGHRLALVCLAIPTLLSSIHCKIACAFPMSWSRSYRVIQRDQIPTWHQWPGKDVLVWDCRAGSDFRMVCPIFPLLSFLLWLSLDYEAHPTFEFEIVDSWSGSDLSFLSNRKLFEPVTAFEAKQAYEIFLAYFFFDLGAKLEIPTSQNR